MLLVLDQFEQWLLAKRGEENTELVAALRHCDGEHVQAMVLVRDDFWMAATRFMRDLEIRLVEGENSAAVDLFDPRPRPKGPDGIRSGLWRLARECIGRSRETRKHSSMNPSRTGRGRQGHLGSAGPLCRDGEGQAVDPATLKEVGGTKGSA